MQANHPLAGLGDLRASYAEIELLGADRTADRPVFPLKLSGPELPGRTLHVDVDTGTILREQTVEVLPGMGEFPISIDDSDFRPIRPLVLPFRVSSSQPSSGSAVIPVSEVEWGIPLTDEDFRLGE